MSDNVLADSPIQHEDAQPVCSNLYPFNQVLNTHLCVDGRYLTNSLQ